MYSNVGGACRIIYKYQPNLDDLFISDRNTLRKWGKIDETEEEYDRKRTEKSKQEYEERRKKKK